jgi:hypothetical protein
VSRRATARGGSGLEKQQSGAGRGASARRPRPADPATINQLLDPYSVLDVGESTRRTYEGYVDKHLRPAPGETLDSFYAVLRRRDRFLSTCRS